MDLLFTALQNDPASRPSAAEFRDQLAELDLSEPESDLDAPPAAATVATGAGSGATGVGRGRRRPTGSRLAMAAVLLVLLVSLVLLLNNVWPNGAVGQSPTSGPVTVAAPTPSTSPPTPSATARTPSADSPSPRRIPDGFTDCSDEVRRGALCTTEPECWGGVIGVADVQLVATPQDCEENHVYQTYAGGPLVADARRQSRLERLPRVKQICRRAVANSMLPRSEQRRWEIIALAPQDDDEMFFRCILGNGQRVGALPLRLPR